MLHRCACDLENFFDSNLSAFDMLGQRFTLLLDERTFPFQLGPLVLQLGLLTRQLGFQFLPLLAVMNAIGT